MYNILSLIFFIGCFVSSGAGVVRSEIDVQEFEAFLRQSVEGKPSDVSDKKLSDLQNLWENSGKFEGDIVLTEEQIHDIVQQYAGTRNAIRSSLWPNKTVYYNISSTFSSAQRNAIIAAMNDISKATCLLFKQRTSQVGYIQIDGKPEGCNAIVGYQGKKQGLNLSPANPGSGCFTHGIIIHEILHGVGFYHMQSTYNRDDYVQIIWSKIEKGREKAFEKYTTSDVSNMSQGYDYGSLMHYSEYAFSVDGSRTIKATQATSQTIGQRVKLSTKDIARINKMYSC